ncbi:MAG: TolC family protein, partial [Bacteroidia bacterium]|nr:TolC family protein [Bacteroidia bacterium]
ANSNVGQLEKSLENIKKLKDETNAMYDAGFAEKLDVDRLILSASNLEININNLKSQSELAKKVLLNSMGLDVNQKVLLTSELPEFSEENFAENYGLDFNKESRIEFQMLEQQQELNELDLKRWKMGYIPSLYGMINYGTNTFGTENNFGELGDDWYPNGMFALSLNVPIFDGFYKKSKTDQIKVNIAKTNNSIEQLSNGISLEVSQARTVYSSAFKSLELQKKNVTLAEEIYKTTSIKFKEGVGSSFELITAESDLTQARTNYLNALYDLSVAKVSLDKALGKL